MALWNLYPDPDPYLASLRTRISPSTTPIAHHPHHAPRQACATRTHEPPHTFLTHHRQSLCGRHNHATQPAHTTHTHHTLITHHKRSSHTHTYPACGATLRDAISNVTCYLPTHISHHITHTDTPIPQHTHPPTPPRMAGPSFASLYRSAPHILSGSGFGARVSARVRDRGRFLGGCWAEPPQM